MPNNLYREIFLKSKKEIDKRLSFFKNEAEIKVYLGFELKNEILKDEEKIRASFNKIKCANCGVCCSLAISEFSPETLENKANHGDKASKSFLSVFENYKGNSPPNEIIELAFGEKKPEIIKDLYFYHCKKVKFKDGKSFCPIYDARPDVCRCFPDTPLENLPKTCAYNVWKDENQIKAMFIKALNDVRKTYLNSLLKEECQNQNGVV